MYLQTITDFIIDKGRPWAYHDVQHMVCSTPIDESTYNTQRYKVNTLA